MRQHIKLLGIPVLCLLAAGIATPANAQERALEIYHGNEISHSILIADIDSIKINEVLAAPATLQATIEDDGITLTWDKVEGATSYEVFHSTDDETYATIATGVKNTTYTHTAPHVGLNYYKVRAMTEKAKSPLSAASAPVTFGGAMTETGLYMGIIGFNQELNTKEISILAPNTKSAFTSFVTGMTSKNGTLLYYAVDNALNRLETGVFPEDLVNVSIVTFTDGLDQGSIMMNPDYATDTEYLSAVNSRIKNMSVQGHPITAYSIGLKGNDVTDEAQFMTNLESLASSSENATEVNSMEEVNAKFQEIADQLYKSSSSQTISLMIPGQSDGTVIRFTFDEVTDAAESAMYIEGTFSLQDRSLQNVTYEGLECDNGTSVTGTQDGIFVTFAFNNLRQAESGETVPTTDIRQWSYIPSTAQWQINSEFTPEGNTITTVERNSAVIMLVLDCSSSLGEQFSDMQTHACQFIDKMAENTEISTGGGQGSTPDTATLDVLSGISYDELAFVEGGTFLMGAQNDYEPEYDWQGVQSSRSLNYDASAGNNESPVHEVTLSSYYIGKYEVTQQLWEYVMNYEGTTPDGTVLAAVGNGPWLGYYTPTEYYGLGDTYPAYHVSYEDIMNYFLPRLNKITGMNYRLPTEAEWEYAARGGQKDEYTRTHTSMTPTTDCAGTYYRYAGSNAITEVASPRMSGSETRTSYRIGLFNPNALGLYDMIGNAAEWCHDWYSEYSSSPQVNPKGTTSGTKRILRGGDSSNYDFQLSSTIRYSDLPSNREDDTSRPRECFYGFRLAHDVE